MRPETPAHPVELIPAAPQTLWGRLAVANFVLGGAGAGFYLVAVVFDRAVAVASWLGPALLLAGFAAVAVEAGRPLRGPRVLGRVRTSWMSRELWLGGAFAVLASSELLVRAPGQRALAGGAALALVLAQGFILRRARGVAAWDVPALPAVFLLSALLSGAGVLALVDVATGRPPSVTFLGALLVLLPLGALVWLAFVTWSSDEPFAGSTRVLREGPAALTIVAAGYVVPFALLALGIAVPEAAALATALAALSMLGAQVQAKAVLVLDAARLRPITLPDLTLGPRHVDRSHAAPHSGPRDLAQGSTRLAAEEADRSRVASLSGHPRLEPAPRHPLQRRPS